MTAPPDRAALDRRMALATGLHRQGRWAEAVEQYRQLAALCPDAPQVHANLGAALQQMGALEPALAACRRAVALAPDQPASLGNLGAVLLALGQPEAALAAFDRAIALRPEAPVTHNNRGNALVELDRLDEALTAYDQALARAPDYAEALSNRSNILYRLGRLDQAVAGYRQAIALAPGEPGAHFNLSLALLKQGRLAEGWTEYEWRPWRGEDGRRAASLTTPRWRGEPPAGRTVLLVAEQGYGDTLQFTRFAPLVAQAGARVVLWVQAPLVRLLRTLPGVAEVRGFDQPAPPHDCWSPLLSLPRCLGPDIPAGTPYLRADPLARAAWAERLAALPGRKVGIVWAGHSPLDDRQSFLTDRRRSLSPAQLAPLAGNADITLVSLQKAPPAAEPPILLWDAMAEMADFADTAALVDGLDLVVAVDTAVAHLAGALGKPVWILSRFDGCWRWLEGRDDSPWYPSARLFRQSAAGDWDGVVTRVNMALQQWSR